MRELRWSLCRVADLLCTSFARSERRLHRRFFQLLGSVAPWIQWQQDLLTNWTCWNKLKRQLFLWFYLLTDLVISLRISRGSIEDKCSGIAGVGGGSGALWVCGASFPFELTCEVFPFTWLTGVLVELTLGGAGRGPGYLGKRLTDDVDLFSGSRMFICTFGVMLAVMLMFAVVAWLVGGAFGWDSGVAGGGLVSGESPAGAAGIGGAPWPTKFRGASGRSVRRYGDDGDRKRLNCSASRCWASCDIDCVEKGICSDISSCGGLVKTNKEKQLTWLLLN